MTCQISDRSCMFACMESILADWGSPITQEELIDRFPDLCHKGENIEGALDITFAILDRIDAQFKLDWQRVNDFVMPGNNEAYIILTAAAGDQHCVKIITEISNDVYSITNPNFNRYYAPNPINVDCAENSSRMPFFLKSKQKVGKGFCYFSLIFLFLFEANSFFKSSFVVFELSNLKTRTNSISVMLMNVE